MTHFNIVRVVADDLVGVQAYQEVIESVQWGLAQLGHHITVSVNHCCAEATNILFGGHLNAQLLIDSPADTILYNLEQIKGRAGFDSNGPITTAQLIASKFRIWDYSATNIETWNGLNPSHAVTYVPIGYAPILTRIQNAEVQDIDVLVYGSVVQRRLSVFASLANLVNFGISTVYACGLYGASRDNLISRAKIVLNINQVETAKIFEIVRVSYLLANHKAVVADVSPDSRIETDMLPGVMFVPLESMAIACVGLLKDDESRLRLEGEGFKCISARDIRGYLYLALT